MNATTLEDEIESARIAYETAALDNSPDVDRLREELRVLTARAGDSQAAARAKLRREAESREKRQRAARIEAAGIAQSALKEAAELLPELDATLAAFMVVVETIRLLDQRALSAVASHLSREVSEPLMYRAFLTTVDVEQAILGDAFGKRHPLAPRVEHQLNALSRLASSLTDDAEGG